MAKRDIRERNRAKKEVNLSVCARCGTICYSSDLKEDPNTRTWVCTRAINNCWNPKDVFEKPIRIGLDHLPKIIQPDFYDPEEHQ